MQPAWGSFSVFLFAPTTCLLHVGGGLEEVMNIDFLSVLRGLMLRAYLDMGWCAEHL